MKKFSDFFKQYLISVTRGHFKIDKTVMRINQHFWHLVINLIIKENVRRCEVCQRNKELLSREETAFIPKLFNYLMEKLRLNDLEPLPETQN